MKLSISCGRVHRAYQKPMFSSKMRRGAVGERSSGRTEASLMGLPVSLTQATQTCAIIEHSEDNIFHPVAAIVCHGSNNNLDWVNLHLHLYHSREPDTFLGYLKTSFVHSWGPRVQT